MFDDRNAKPKTQHKLKTENSDTSIKCNRSPNANTTNTHKTETQPRTQTALKREFRSTKVWCHGEDGEVEQALNSMSSTENAVIRVKNLMDAVEWPSSDIEAMTAAGVAVQDNLQEMKLHSQNLNCLLEVSRHARTIREHYGPGRPNSLGVVAEAFGKVDLLFQRISKLDSYPGGKTLSDALNSLKSKFSLKVQVMPTIHEIIDNLKSLTFNFLPLGELTEAHAKAAKDFAPNFENTFHEFMKLAPWSEDPPPEVLASVMSLYNDMVQTYRKLDVIINFQTKDDPIALIDKDIVPLVSGMARIKDSRQVTHLAFEGLFTLEAKHMVKWFTTAHNLVTDGIKRAVQHLIARGHCFLQIWSAFWLAFSVFLPACCVLACVLRSRLCYFKGGVLQKASAFSLAYSFA